MRHWSYSDAMRCDVVRFVAFEDLGVWEAELIAHGFDVRYLDVGVDDVAEAADADLAVVLGAPIDADDDARYPVLAAVRGALAARVEQDRPTLAICLGAQILAQVVGGTVQRGTREIGWAPLTPQPAAAASAWRELSAAPVLHWHADEVGLPAGAYVGLASTAATRHQIFEVGRSVGFQCHPEADPEMIERWLIGHTGDLTRWGVDINAVRAQGREFGDAAVAAGLTGLRRWLRQVDLVPGRSL